MPCVPTPTLDPRTRSPPLPSPTRQPDLSLGLAQSQEVLLAPSPPRCGLRWYTAFLSILLVKLSVLVHHVEAHVPWPGLRVFFSFLFLGLYWTPRCGSVLGILGWVFILAVGDSGSGLA